jgi:hypothetical protein
MRSRVTPEALESFKAGDWLGLHRALRLRPFEASPLDVSAQGCVYPLGSAYAHSWPQALALLEELRNAE